MPPQGSTDVAIEETITSNDGGTATQTPGTSNWSVTKGTDANVTYTIGNSNTDAVTDLAVTDATSTTESITNKAQADTDYTFNGTTLTILPGATAGRQIALTLTGTGAVEETLVITIVGQDLFTYQVSGEGGASGTATEGVQQGAITLPLGQTLTLTPASGNTISAVNPASTTYVSAAAGETEGDLCYHPGCSDYRNRNRNG